MPTPSGSFNRFPQIMHELPRLTDQVVRATAYAIRDSAVSSMEGGKSGREYRVPGVPGGVHRASAPGEAPAILFGQLANSVDVMLPEQNLALVTVNDEKGPWMEFGTSRQAARPFLSPAADKHRDEFAHAMRSILGRFR